MCNENDENKGYSEIEEDEIIDDYKSRKVIKIIAVITVLFFGIMILSPLFAKLNLPSLIFLKESAQLTQKPEVKELQNAVVSITVDGRKGTGFNIEEEGVIVTNAHVVKNAESVMVSFYKGKKVKGEVWKLFEDIDIALVKIQGRDFPKLELEQSIEVSIEDEVLIIGNPLNYEGVVNKGTVFGRVKVSGIEEPILLIEAPVNKGNSGSPVINEKGKVIGIIFGTIKDQNLGDIELGAAIPIEYLQKKR